MTRLEVWAIARRDLGLTDAEFRMLTPRQFVALWGRERERALRLEYCLGMVCATVANCMAGRDKHPEAFQPHEFIGWLPRAEEEREPEAFTAEDWWPALLALHNGPEPKAAEETN